MGLCRSEAGRWSHPYPRPLSLCAGRREPTRRLPARTWRDHAGSPLTSQGNTPLSRAPGEGLGVRVLRGQRLGMAHTSPSQPRKYFGRGVGVRANAAHACWSGSFAPGALGSARNTMGGLQPSVPDTPCCRLTTGHDRLAASPCRVMIRSRPCDLSLARAVAWIMGTHGPASAGACSAAA